MANDSEIFELYKQHQTGQDKYTYFLLATAAAAIAFAVQKTEGLRLSWWLLPSGAAILCRGASFSSDARIYLNNLGAVGDLTARSRGTRRYGPSFSRASVAAGPLAWSC